VKLGKYLKFLPLVALFAFGVTLISLPKTTSAAPLGAPTLSLTFVPLNSSTVVSAMYNDEGGSAVLTGAPALGTFIAGATVSPANGETVTSSGATVTVTDDADTLPTTKTVSATFTCTQIGIMTFTLSHGGTTSAQSVTLVCGDYSIYGQNPYGQYGYPYGGYPYSQYPYGNTTYPTYNTATAVTVSASPASSTCASPSSISIAVRDQAGNPAANGTSVTVSASTGTVSPNVVSTSGGVASTTFTAPNSSNGTATVTATSGTGTGYATVAFSCTSGSTAPIAPSAPIYTAPVGPITILPPNTGDAGLADQARSTTSAGIALAGLSIAGLGVGALSLRRQRAER
jgi:hypothetical protein